MSLAQLLQRFIGSRRHSKLLAAGSATPQVGRLGRAALRAGDHVDCHLNFSVVWVRAKDCLNEQCEQYESCCQARQTRSVPMPRPRFSGPDAVLGARSLSKIPKLT
jgi:hypothetical protein